jgi:hypothetical protein
VKKIQEEAREKGYELEWVQIGDHKTMERAIANEREVIRMAMRKTLFEVAILRHKEVPHDVVKEQIDIETTVLLKADIVAANKQDAEKVALAQLGQQNASDDFDAEKHADELEVICRPF